MTVREIYDYIDQIAPFSTAAQWDNSGLIVGGMTDYVEKIVLCLDVNKTVIDYAVSENAQLIISHHPVIFRPVKSFTDDNPAYYAATKGISIISAHTNLDKVSGGVNDTLCTTLGFDFKKMPEEICDGFLNIIDIETGISPVEMTDLLKNRLHTSVSYCDAGKRITRIGVCCGAGADFINEAVSAGCNGYITGEASYHEFLDAKYSGVSLFACGHFETEIPIISKLKELLSAEFNNATVLDYVEKNSIITEI